MAVEAAIHLVHNRRVEITAAQKIGVQRMHHPVGHGHGSGGQGLSQHLAAEHLRTADVTALAAKQIDLELFELEEIQQIGNLGFMTRVVPAQPNLSTPRITELWPGKVHR